eukprot:TRINITY_DN5545_c0_g1_i1.p1 TRINITY_DN5545_c0_g1~~TRINITY_DN5545_c0_g1_i1.p1  ORF type:complete len:223 (-),score=64.37 TRINITY_DN5545_c0_g1_i1:409-1077(-)
MMLNEEELSEEIVALKQDPRWIEFLDRYAHMVHTLKEKYKLMRETLTQKEIRLEKEKLRLKNLKYRENRTVTLNVRGHRFTTKIHTIVNGAPDSLLSMLFAEEFGVELDENNEVYIDREGRYFHFIMEFIRDGFVLMPNDRDIHLKVAREAKFYGLENMLKILKVQYRVEPPSELELEKENVRSVEETTVVTNAASEAQVNRPVLSWDSDVSDSEEFLDLFD